MAKSAARTANQSTTDLENVLYRKANGQAGKLCFGAQVLKENRPRLFAAFMVHPPKAEDGPTVALAQAKEPRQLPAARVKRLGADQAYHQNEFVTRGRERAVSPLEVCKSGIKVSRSDECTTRHKGYRTGQRSCKQAEEILGWLKTLAGLRRTRYRGMERMQAWA